MIHFIIDQGEHEAELAFDKHQVLSLRDLEGRVIATVRAPICGWSTTDLREASASVLRGDQCGIDAFVGDQWVGSTEV